MLTLTKILGLVAAASLAAAPAMAAPTKPAASLSIVKSVRAASVTSKKNKLADGGTFIAIAAAVAAVVAIVIIASNDDNDDSN